MANEIRLAATTRTEFGKGAARRIRRDHQVPAVMYGHGADPVHITLPGHDTLLALRTANALLSVSIDGGAAQLALPKQVQRDPIKGFLEHVDLVVVRRGEKVTVEVPLVIVNDDRDDRLVNLDQQTVRLEVEATHIPADVQVDVGGWDVGHVLTAADLPLPEGAVFHGAADDVILSIVAAPSAGDIAAELDAAVAGAAGEQPAAAEASETEGDEE